MSSAARRTVGNVANWSKVAEKLVTDHAAELNKLRAQHTTFAAIVNTLPAELPKVDFAALKKQIPSHTQVLDQLQKQYEALAVPYGEVPKNLLDEVDKWTSYNNERQALDYLKTQDGLEKAKKVEAKWARAPPVEHFSREHFSEFFPQQFYDIRKEERVPDICGVGLNDAEGRAILQKRFADYKVSRREDKVDEH